VTAFRPISEAARSWSCDNSCCCLNLTTYSLPNLNLTTVVVTSHYSRSKAHGPNIPASEEGDVEPDCVAPVAATHPVSDIPATTPVRSSVAAAGEPGSMATESAGPVSVPSTSPEGKPSSGGGPGTSGPVGSPQMGVFFGYPSGLQVRLKLTPKLEDGCSHCHRRNWITTHRPPQHTAILALSGSGVVGTLAAAVAAAGEGLSPAAQQLHSLHPHATVPYLTYYVGLQISSVRNYNVFSRLCFTAVGL